LGQPGFPECWHSGLKIDVRRIVADEDKMDLAWLNIATQGTTRLQELVKARFPHEGKSERIAQALAALHEEESIKLSSAEWKWVAEGADLEDRF
jgi:hypothetical protein